MKLLIVNTLKRDDDSAALLRGISSGVNSICRDEGLFRGYLKCEVSDITE